MTRQYKIDAANRPLGRLASEIAQILRGKLSPDFAPYKESSDVVIVENVEKIALTGKKQNQKTYFSHSGYPKGAKTISFAKVFKSDPEKVLRQAVSGMLPKNKLSEKIIKKLRFKKGENAAKS